MNRLKQNQKLDSSSVVTSSETGGAQTKKKFGFSEINVNRAFKNLLRNSSDNNEYKEHKSIPFRERESRAKQDKNVFDDTYQKTENSEQNKQKFVKNYVKGNLRTNINFDYERPVTPPPEVKNSRIRIKLDTEIRYSNMNKTTIEEYPQAIKDPIKLRKINDVFNKNPLEILTKNQHQDLSTQQKQKSYVRFQRVSNYLGSEGFKSSVNNCEGSFVTASDKITNMNVEKVKNSLLQKQNDTKKFAIKSFTRLYENNRVYYD